MYITKLIGKTFTKIQGLNKDSECARFESEDGRSWKMYHAQDCCESVYIEDVCGDVDDLIGSPIARAETPSSLDGFDEKVDCGGYESQTWTFIILGTAKGTVTIRWYGTSNGYYCETPCFREVTGE